MGVYDSREARNSSVACQLDDESPMTGPAKYGGVRRSSESKIMTEPQNLWAMTAECHGGQLASPQTIHATRVWTKCWHSQQGLNTCVIGALLLRPVTFFKNLFSSNRRAAQVGWQKHPPRIMDCSGAGHLGLSLACLYNGKTVLPSGQNLNGK